VWSGTPTIKEASIVSDLIDPDDRREPIDFDTAANTTYRDDRTLPGDTTVPVWALASIVLGLLALTGSLVILCLVGTAAILVWLAYVGSKGDGASGRASRGPLGGPGPWR
jgi:hypothetical protein